MDIGALISTATEEDCYCIVRELKSGGQGTAYQAMYIPDNAPVVIKAVRADVLVNEPDMTTLFPLEGRVGQAVITHPNVVKTFAYVRPEDSGRGIAYIVMEYVEGANLADYLDRQDVLLEQDLLLSWMRQLISGLDAIHRIAIHRDIKPRNVMVSGETLKIIDFGMARFGADETVTAARGKGSQKYMAPETWQSKHGSTATDIYSLGTLFYQMTTLSLPYVADNDDDLRELHQYGPIPRPSARRPKLDPRLNKLIMTMMAHDPAARPPLEEIGQTLEAIILKPTPPLPATLLRALASAEATQQRVAEIEARTRALQEEQERRVRRATHGVEDLAAQLDGLISLLNTQLELPITSEQENIYPLSVAPFDYIIVHRTYAYNRRHLELRLQGMPFENIGPDGQVLPGPGQAALAFGTLSMTYLVKWTFAGGHSHVTETGPFGLFLLLEGSIGNETWQAYAVEKTTAVDGGAETTTRPRRPLFPQLEPTIETLIKLLRTPSLSDQEYVVQPRGPIDETLLGDLLDALVGDGFTEDAQGKLE